MITNWKQHNNKAVMNCIKNETGEKRWVKTMKTMYEFSKSEIQEELPYGLICETRYGSHWETMKRKRLWKELFTDVERKLAKKIFSRSHLWYLGKGVPDKVVLSADEFDLWIKIADFCIQI